MVCSWGTQNEPPEWGLCGQEGQVLWLCSSIKSFQQHQPWSTKLGNISWFICSVFMPQMPLKCYSNICAPQSDKALNFKQQTIFSIFCAVTKAAPNQFNYLKKKYININQVTSIASQSCSSAILSTGAFNFGAGSMSCVCCHGNPPVSFVYLSHRWIHPYIPPPLEMSLKMTPSSKWRALTSGCSRPTL